MLRKLIWIWKRTKCNSLLQDHQLTHKTIQRISVYREIIFENKRTLCSVLFRCFVFMIYNYDIMIAGYDIIMLTFCLYVRRETYCFTPNSSSSASASSYITLFGAGVELVCLQEQCLHIILGPVGESHKKMRPLWTWPLRSRSNDLIFISGMLTGGYLLCAFN